MIARIWRGTTRFANADRYQEYLVRFIVPCCQTVEGNEGMYILKEHQGEFVHFLLLSFWSSNEALANYIGAAVDVVNPTPEEKNLLIAFESTARHYKVIADHFNQAMQVQKRIDKI